MSTAGEGDVWTGPQLAARLLVLNGVAPEAVQHVLFRETRRADGRVEAGYCVPELPCRLAEPAFLTWLAERGIAGADRLAVAVLVIRETLNEAEQLRECVLERRRGGVDGPFCGDPARVEFTGPAQMVRLYRALRNGRLQEIAASPEAAPPWPRVATRFAGEMDALRAQFGAAVAVLDLREPTLFEEVAGLSAIAQLRLPDGRESGCGVGWFGTLPFVLEAAFPRFGARLDLAPDDAAAVDRLLREHGLVHHELRLDVGGLSVMARRLGGLELFQARVEDGAVHLVPYDPRPEAAAAKDQLRWMRYAEQAERLAALDAYREGAGDDLIVLTGDPRGQVWRHAIDADGVELWRRPDDAAAVGVLHRERLFPGVFLAAETAVVPPPVPAAADRVMPATDTVLARMQAYGAVLAALQQARGLATGTVPGEIELALQDLAEAVHRLGAPVAASAVATLLRQLAGAPDVPVLPALAEVEARLHDELARVQLVPVTPLPWLAAESDAPFGQAVADGFPAAAYDIDEALRCLALGRSSAAMLHAMRVVQAGLAALARLLGNQAVAAGNWAVVIAALRAQQERCPGILPVLEPLRRRWRSAGMQPAGKYTAEEADQALQALAAFLRVLAGLCDETGAPA